MNESQVAEHWRTYKSLGSTQSRDKLLEHYKRIPEKCLARAEKRFSPPKEGLLWMRRFTYEMFYPDSIKLYDPADGVEYERLAFPYIREGILALINQFSPLPQLPKERNKVKDRHVSFAIHSLTQKNRRIFLMRHVDLDSIEEAEAQLKSTGNTSEDVYKYTNEALSFEEIGLALDMPEDEVRKRYNYCLRKISTTLHYVGDKTVNP